MVAALDYDSDIDPDDLLPSYISYKTNLFHLQETKFTKVPRGGSQSSAQGQMLINPDSSVLLRKIKKIEDDVLFDDYLAGRQWEVRRIQLEREAAARRNAAEADQDNSASDTLVGSDDEVSREAFKIGASVLEENESDDDTALADLFASLPVNEVDPLTGKSSVIINGKDGVKVTIRDFGKWMGVNPARVLEEACRARDSSVKLSYSLVSESSFSNQHSLHIIWSKAQEMMEVDSPIGIDFKQSPKMQSFTMTSISTPDAKQSEAYIATTALFLVFGSSAKEDKVFLRLPATWRELWTEFANAKKEKVEREDREAIRTFRDMVRKKKDQEMEDGVLIQGAFRNRGSARAQETAEESGSERNTKSTLSAEAYQRIWEEKSRTPNYQMMLVSSHQLLPRSH